MSKKFSNIIFFLFFLWGCLSLLAFLGMVNNTLSAGIVTLVSITTMTIEIIALFIVLNKTRILIQNPLCRIVLVWMVYSSVVCLFTAQIFYIEIREVLWFPSVFVIFYYIGITDSEYKDNTRRIFKYTLLWILPVNVLMYALIRYTTYSYEILASTPLSSSNHIFFVLLLLPFISYIQSKRTKYILLVVVIVAILFSFKRSALICSTIILLQSVYFDYFKGRKLVSVLKYLPILLIIFLVANALFNNVDSLTEGHISQRIESTEEDQGSGRTELWQKLLSKLPDGNIVFGNGHNGVRKDKILIDERSSNFPYVSAHNDFLEVIYDFGVVGFLLYWVYIVRVLRICRKRIIGKYEFLHQAMCMACVIFLVMSFVSHLVLYPTYYAYLLMIFAMSCGTIKRQISYERDKRNNTLL